MVRKRLFLGNREPPPRTNWRWRGSVLRKYCINKELGTAKSTANWRWTWRGFCNPRLNHTENPCSGSAQGLCALLLAVPFKARNTPRIHWSFGFGFRYSSFGVKKKLVAAAKFPDNDRMLEHAIIHQLRVPPGQKVRLKDYDTGWKQTKE